MQKLYLVKVKSCLVMKTCTKILCVNLIFIACASPINTPPLTGRSRGKLSKSMDQTVLSVLSYLPPHTLNQSCLVWLLRRDTAMNTAVFLALMVSQMFPETATLQNSQGVPLSLALTVQPEHCVQVLLTSNLMGTLWCVKSLSRVRLFATPWTVAYQASPSMGFSRQEYRSGLPFPSPGDLADPGIEPRSPALQADSLPTEPTREAL